LRNAIQRTASIYTDVFSYPQLMHFYAAQKIAHQLNTFIKVDFEGVHDQHITISIPSRKPVM
jgi:hypothetical protein